LQDARFFFFDFIATESMSLMLVHFAHVSKHWRKVLDVWLVLWHDAADPWQPVCFQGFAVSSSGGSSSRQFVTLAFGVKLSYEKIRYSLWRIKAAPYLIIQTVLRP
jgi:hypothetical protein